jgi:hypothetical protein
MDSFAFIQSNCITYIMLSFSSYDNRNLVFLVSLVLLTVLILKVLISENWYMGLL